MLAGGMVVAAPSMVPEATAAGQLFVSAENAMFNNYFVGAQIVEIIVKDPNRIDTDELESEPTVKVNEFPIRLAQGADGYWYAYIVEANEVAKADANANIDFGVQSAPIGVTFDPAITPYHTVGVIGQAPALSIIDLDGGFVDGAESGQIGINPTQWPIVQALDFTLENIDIKLEQPGADEIVSLKHDNDDIDDYAGIELDRNAAHNNAELHLTITDQALNLDPTTEDVVVFDVTPGSESVSFKMTSDYGLVQTLTVGDVAGTGYTTGDSITVAGGVTATVTATDGVVNSLTIGSPGDGTITTDGDEVATTTTDGGDNTLTVDYTINSGYNAFSNGFDDNGKLIIDYDTQGTGIDVLTNDATLDDETADNYILFWESAENSGIFYNTDDDDDSNLNVSSDALRGTTATIDYNDSAQSFVVAYDFATIDMDASSVGDEWNSGEEITIVLYDQDLNLNTLKDEDLTVAGGTLVPSIQIGNPVSLDQGAVTISGTNTAVNTATVALFSKIATADISAGDTTLIIDTGITGADLANISANYDSVSIDVSSFGTISNVEVCEVGSYVDGATCTADGTTLLDVATTTGKFHSELTTSATDDATEDIIVEVTLGRTSDQTDAPFHVDFFSFSDSVNNAIYRVELEESGDNTGEFIGSAEYVMLNQINFDQDATFDRINPTQDDVDMIVHLDMTDEDSIRVNYLDLGADGVSTQVADQEEAPTHSGSADLDLDSYKIADTVVVTINDQDLNTDSELIDVYITTDGAGGAADLVGKGTDSHVVDITFDDVQWNDLSSTGFTLVESGIDSGIFIGSFQVPEEFDHDLDGGTSAVPATGTDIEVNYNDFRDGSGNTIEVGDGASIRANTGSVAFDRTVYPVPFAANTYAVHETAGSGYLDAGPVQVHIRVTDADYDISATGEDTLPINKLDVKITRGSLASANLASTTGNILETAPDSAVFEYDLQIASDAIDGSGTFPPNSIINQGDIITVTYSDPQDASGEPQTVTDSSSFDLRNGVLQSDKSVYLIGSDMILTLIEPDFDLDNDETESYTLDLIEWDSDAAEISMGILGGFAASFDPEPSDFRETGDSTGIFQVVIEIPDTLDNELLDRGEQIDLEYTDEGPAGADYVGQEDEDIGLTVYTSNFGATVELDQKVYTWTDKVYITIVAPDHNFDSGLVDNIGESSNDPIKISTRGNEIDRYQLVESGADTGIFIGEVTLKGFIHDADGDGSNDITMSAAALTSDSYDGDGTPAQTGPTEGELATTDNDGLTVSFEFSEDETVVGSALIRWNIGEVQWLEASYSASGTGVVRVIDADMSLDPESVDNFDVDVWSDSDAGGIDLTVTETNEATGIFEGTVFFTTSDDSSGHRLRVAEGDTVTAEYEDNTLPDPYTTADELDITATSLIGTVVPPLERAPAANLRTVDAFGNSLNAVGIDQQVQLTADLVNGQDKDQSFAYLVQVQDGDGVTVSLAWITGSLSSGQSFSPALSWIPTESGSYTATAFVWESVDNPTALSPPVSTTITIQ